MTTPTQVLSDEQIDAIAKSHTFGPTGIRRFARAIEAAVLASIAPAADARPVPTERGVYAWVAEGSAALVLVHTRPTDHSKGGVFNGSVIRNSTFYDGCAIDHWTGGTWYGPLKKADSIAGPAEKVTAEAGAFDAMEHQILLGYDKSGDAIFGTDPKALALAQQSAAKDAPTAPAQPAQTQAALDDNSRGILSDALGMYARKHGMAPSQRQAIELMLDRLITEKEHK